MSLVSRIANLFARSRVDSEIEAELQAHIDLRIDDNVANGMLPAEARRDALLRFGNRTATRESVAGVDTALSLGNFGSDLRYAVRQLRRSPGFTLTAVATLALAIGANALVFAVMNALFLRPLNVPHGDSLYALQRGNATYIEQSYPDYLDLRDRNRSFDALAAYNISQVGLDLGNNPISSWGYETSGNYFDALGIQPYVGRFFHGSDEHGLNSSPYLVLTYAYWHSRFQDDRSVVGRQVRLNKHPFTIIGVAPPEFHGTLLFFSPDFFVPMIDTEQIEGVNYFNTRGLRWVFEVLGHLKPGVTPAQATADVTSIGAYLHSAYPKEDDQSSFSLVRPGLHGEFFAPAARAFLTGLMLLGGLILLAACANLGSLFAARAADRSREVALRLALGSSRKRILRGLFTEALLISLGGGAAGIAGSVVLLQRLSAWRPFPQFPINIAVNPDAHVYWLALLLALVSGFLFGAVPVRQVLRTNPYEVVKAGSTGLISGRRISIRDLLLVVQVALCAVLVTASMVALRGLARSLHSNLGVEPRNGMLAQTELSMAGYRGDAIPVMQRRMLDAVQAIPGVTAAGLVNSPPMHMGWSVRDVFAETTTDLRPSNAVAEAINFTISPGYFEAAGTALMAGRAFTWNDDKTAPPVAVVNRVFARTVFHTEAAPLAGTTSWRMAGSCRWWALRKTANIPPTSPRGRKRRCFSPSCNRPRPRRGWWCVRVAIRRNLPGPFEARCGMSIRDCLFSSRHGPKR